MLFVFMYAYWCPTRFPFQMTLVSFNSNRTDVTGGAETANQIKPERWKYCVNVNPTIILLEESQRANKPKGLNLKRTDNDLQNTTRKIKDSETFHFR
jgi:hypothetical protein